MSRGRYRYRFHDLRTNDWLADLPLQDVKYSDVLNSAGEWSASLKIADVPAAIDWRAATRKRRTAVYMDRSGTLIFGGIIWDRSLSGDGDVLKIEGAGFWSYLKRRIISSDVNRLGTDEFTIAQDLVSDAQGVTGGDIGIIVPATTAGVNQTLNVKGTDLRYLADVIDEMGDHPGGFDRAITVAYDAFNAPQKTLELWYPQRGRTASASGLVFSFPGNITALEFEEDATDAPTKAWIAGGTDASNNPIVASATDSAGIAAGEPLIEVSKTQSADTDATSLDDRAANLLAATGGGGIPQISVRGTENPDLATYAVGDQCRVRIDAKFNSLANSQYDGTWRIIEREVEVSNETEDETVKLVLGPLVSSRFIPFPATHEDQMSDFDRRLLSLEQGTGFYSGAYGTILDGGGGAISGVGGPPYLIQIRAINADLGLGIGVDPGFTSFNLDPQYEIQYVTFETIPASTMPTTGTGVFAGYVHVLTAAQAGTYIFNVQQLLTDYPPALGQAYLARMGWDSYDTGNILTCVSYNTTTRWAMLVGNEATPASTDQPFVTTMTHIEHVPAGAKFYIGMHSYANATPDYSGGSDLFDKWVGMATAFVIPD